MSFFTNSYISGGGTYYKREYWDWPWVPHKWAVQSTESMESISHHLPIDTDGDDGGPWKLTKSDFFVSAGYAPPSGGNIYGNFGIGSNTGAYSPPSMLPPLTAFELYSKGTTAIARTLPTNPAFDLSVAIGELRSDGLPSISGAELWKSKSLEAKHAGSEYLNVQFGWIPLVNDITNFCESVRDADKIIRQYVKQSDQKIKRTYTFPQEDLNEVYTGSFFPLGSSDFGFLGGSMSTFVHRKTWFKGAYRYHLPISNGQLSKLQKYRLYAEHILGIRLTPEVLWNLAPWSWAADWFGNIGDVMTNISNLGKDGLVLQYGYIMSESIRTVDTTGYLDWAGAKRYTSSRSLDVVKQRLPATPYGFGVSFASLSAKQIAILSALGLSWKW